MTKCHLISWLLGGQRAQDSQAASPKSTLHFGKMGSRGLLSCLKSSQPKFHLVEQHNKRLHAERQLVLLAGMLRTSPAIDSNRSAPPAICAYCHSGGG